MCTFNPCKSTAFYGVWDPLELFGTYLTSYPLLYFILSIASLLGWLIETLLHKLEV